MKLQDLISEIRNDSKNELAKLEYGREKEIEDLLQFARLEKMHLKEKTDEEIEKKSNDIEKEIMGTAELICRKNTLKEKKRITNKAMSEGIKLLLKDKKYNTFLKKEIKNAKKGAIFEGNKTDKVLLSLLKKPPKHKNIAGGIIIHEGTMTKDRSIESLLEKNKSLEGVLQNFIFKEVKE